jgi:predicted transposase/invertase (TIGR01784 family)
LLIDFLNQLLPSHHQIDFEYDEAEEIRKFRRDVSLKDQDGEVFFDKLHFKFLQMPLFNKKENELATKFDKWCYFLKNLESFDHIPNILNEPIFQKAFGTAELANLSIEQRAIYEENLIQYWGMKSALETAVEEREIEIAKNLILLGSENEFIAKATNLSVEQIKQLRNEIKKN